MAQEDSRKSDRQSRPSEPFDYKDFKRLQRYINSFGQIEARKRTNLSEKQQNQLTKSIKRARHIALLPFSQR